MNSFICFILTHAKSNLVIVLISQVVLMNMCFGQQLTPSLRQLDVTVPPITTSVPDTLELDLNQSIATQLLSFADLYNLAVSFSPVLKYQNEVALSTNATYRLSKLEVLNRISGFANYSTGNQALISNTPLGNESIGQIANGYRTGINVQLSLYDLFGRPQQIRQARANSKAALLQIDVLKLQLKRELNTVYQDMLLSQQLMKVRIQEEQVILSAYRVAEIEAGQGVRSPTEIASIFSIYTLAKVTAEEAKAAFLKNAFYLESLVGLPIHQLKRK